jgi:hypothetical protein
MTEHMMRAYVGLLREKYGEKPREASTVNESIRSEVERRSAARRSRMSDDLKLPPLLEHRRTLYGITDGAFKRRALYDRIVVYQLGNFEGQETFGDTSILMPDMVKSRDKFTAPRGVIVSAGLKALDNLRSHGVDLGHVVTFVRNVPWQIESDVIDGKTEYVLILRDGDLIASEDTERLVRHGYLTEAAKTEDGVTTHLYEGGPTPQTPWMTDDQ